MTSTFWIPHLATKIRSYLDDDEKASLQEKGHLPEKDMNHKISITFAGARFDFAS